MPPSVLAKPPQTNQIRPARLVNPAKSRQLGRGEGIAPISGVRKRLLGMAIACAVGDPGVILSTVSNGSGAITQAEPAATAMFDSTTSTPTVRTIVRVRGSS